MRCVLEYLLLISYCEINLWYNTCHQLCAQYLKFLVSVANLKDCPINRFSSQHKVPNDIAKTIWRPRKKCPWNDPLVSWRSSTLAATRKIDCLDFMTKQSPTEERRRGDIVQSLSRPLLTRTAGNRSRNKSFGFSGFGGFHVWRPRWRSNVADIPRICTHSFCR